MTFKRTHAVKSWTFLYEAIISGKKKYDLRDARDRSFEVGDILLLQEFDITKGIYTGREQSAIITYITDRDTPCALSSTVLASGFAILGIELV